MDNVTRSPAARKPDFKLLPRVPSQTEVNQSVNFNRLKRLHYKYNSGLSAHSMRVNNTGLSLEGLNMLVKMNNRFYDARK